MSLETRAEAHVFVAASLDGFIAREDDDVSWLEPYNRPGEDAGYGAFIASMDGQIMGRRTFEKTLTFGDWPHDKPVVVLSRSERPLNAPAGADVRLSQSPPADLLVELAAVGWSRVYVDGGQVIQSFLQADLIESLTVTRVPILLGRGRPLFGPLEREMRLEARATTTLPSGLVQTRYVRSR